MNNVKAMQPATAAAATSATAVAASVLGASPVPAAGAGRASFPRPAAKWRPRLAAALLALLLFACLHGGFSAASSLAGLYDGHSLRYNTPLGGAQAKAARQHALDAAPNSGYWPSFWSEAEHYLETTLHSASSRCIFYSGDGAAVWPCQFTSGFWPGATDIGGCVISEKLALQLWGDTQVVGKTLFCGSTSYMVRGVFAGEEALALFYTGDDGYPDGWNAVELRPHQPQEGATKTGLLQKPEDFATAAGQGRPSSSIDGKAIAGMAAFFAMLPTLLLVLACLALFLARQLRHFSKATKTICLFAFLFLFALTLPGIISLLPPALVPTKWSDFSYWQQFIHDIKTSFTSFLFVYPRLRDVEGYTALLKLLLLLPAQLVLGGALMWRCFSAQRRSSASQSASQLPPS